MIYQTPCFFYMLRMDHSDCGTRGFDRRIAYYELFDMLASTLLIHQLPSFCIIRITASTQHRAISNIDTT